MQFIDEATIYAKAGDGGNGSAAMRASAGVPHGGPCGGDGGRGGSIIAVADGNLATLLDFKYRQHYKAERGEHGRNQDQYGAGGADLILRVPVGTVIYEAETEQVVADLTVEGARCVIAKGGNGGRGNLHFKTAWDQAPRKAEDGVLGAERKLLADVGLLGYPNVGKSTFISRVSRARPKIADYPFTTLVPNLGVVRVSDRAQDERTFVIADIPGLIEGAADGAGLGHQFLRHVERCRVLLHIVEDTFTTGEDRAPLKDYDVINAELEKYAPGLKDKPQVVVLNKLDAGTTTSTVDELKAQFKKRGVTLLTMSAVAGTGLPAVLEALWTHLVASKTP